MAERDGSDHDGVVDAMRALNKAGAAPPKGQGAEGEAAEGAPEGSQQEERSNAGSVGGVQWR